MAHIQARDTFFINADKIRVEGRHTTDNEIDFETDSNKKIRFNQPLDIDNANGAFIQGKKGQQLIKDETGNAVMEIKSDGNLRLLTSVDFNNQAPVNFSGGGGGGATTTSGIASENLVGSTLEDELDAITTQQTTNTGAIGTNTSNITALTTQQTANTTAIGTNTTNIAANTTQIGTNTTNIATNTTAISGFLLQQQSNTNNIATNTAGVTALQTQQATNAGDIATLQTTQTAHASDIGTLQNTQGSQQTSINNLQTQQTTNTGAITTLTSNDATHTTNITNLQTQQGTNTTDIGALQTQQTLNTAAIASNTARTSNLTADRILISSATGTINTAGIGVTDVATKNSSNTFNAPLGNPATQNAFDTISASTINNSGTTESTALTIGGAALNFSHLAGSAASSQLPTAAVRTDVADQTIQGTGTSGALTKVTIDNTHASGNSQFVLQKRSTGGVLEQALQVQATSSGINITGQAAAGTSPDISITPANGSLAMTIGGLETRCHNNFKILGSLQGAARNDSKDYIFKTLGATGTGDTLLLEDVILRPTTGNPAQGFNPAADSLIQLNSSGVPSYRASSDFLAKPAGLPTNPSAVLIDSAGATTYLDSSKVLTKPGGNDPSVTSFVAVQTGGTFTYVPSSFVPLPGGALPSSNENVVFVNPAGTSYVERANMIERPGNANPTSGTKLITINNVGTRAYKDLGQFLTTPNNANPSSDSFIKISSTGVQSYVAESSLGGISKPGGANPASSSVIKLDSAGNETYLEESALFKTNVAAQTITQGITSTAVDINSSNGGVGIETHFKVSTTGTPAGTADNDFEVIPKRGTNTELRSKNDMDWYVDGNRKFGLGNHNATMYQPLQMDNDFRLKHGQTVPTSSSSTGVVGTILFDDNFIYIARSTNSWKRVAISNF